MASLNEINVRKRGKIEYQNPFIFPSGDVRLITSSSFDDQLIGSVSSNALSLASPVWKKCLFPPWNADDKPVEELDCSEDHASALFILLSIAHLEFAKVPIKKIEYERLRQLAILCDKYDCVHLVEPWVECWLRDEDIESLYSGQEGWLMIAWVFGREEVFENLAVKLVRDIKTDEYGRCLDYLGDPFSEPTPPGITGGCAPSSDFPITKSKLLIHPASENMLAIRETKIKELLNIASAEVRQFSPHGLLCVHSYPKCDAIHWGSITRGLEAVDLWPCPAPERIVTSINELVEDLKSVRIFELDPSHRACCKRNFRDDINYTLSTIASPLTDAHRLHFSRQK